MSSVPLYVVSHLQHARLIGHYVHPLAYTSDPDRHTYIIKSIVFLEFNKFHFDNCLMFATSPFLVAALHALYEIPHGATKLHGYKLGQTTRPHTSQGNTK